MREVIKLWKFWQNNCFNEWVDPIKRVRPLFIEGGEMPAQPAICYSSFNIMGIRGLTVHARIGTIIENDRGVIQEKQIEMKKKMKRKRT